MRKEECYSKKICWGKRCFFRGMEGLFYLGRNYVHLLGSNLPRLMMCPYLETCPLIDDIALISIPNVGIKGY